MCNAADPEDDEGLYAALAAVHAELNQHGLAKFCLPSDPITASAPPAMPARMPSFGSADASQTTIPTSAVAQPNLPTVNMPSNSLPISAAATPFAAQAAGMSKTEQAALTELDNLAAGAEVVCIVRPLNDPRAKSRVLVLDNASPEFLKQLATDSGRQNARHVTSHDVRDPQPTATTRRTEWKPKR
ncbi:MAG: hypothetical protein QM775_01120 [Pirellulales bacterium]